MKYTHKDPAEMQYAENQKRLRLEAELLKQRILNEVLTEHDAEFHDQLAAGGLSKVDGAQDDLGRLFRSSARAQLEQGDADS